MEYAYVNGPVIRSLRNELGLSQEDLARVAGVKLNTQQQLSPQWANASTLDRAVAAFTVITTCEGNQP